MIHARETENGIMFRVHSVRSLSYLTDEMTEQELRAWLSNEGTNLVTKELLRDVDGSIQRAAKNGTSSELGLVQDLKGPW